MEELLQLHIVIPEEVPDNLHPEINGRFDDVHELLEGHFPVPNKDVPSYDHLGTTVSSSLFERRSDNLKHIDGIEAQLKDWYAKASVFRSSYEHSFGEFRSPADPDNHILLLVTNCEIEEPTIRWKLKKETLQAPPLVLDDEIFHANHGGIFAIDSASGDVLWEADDCQVVQVPVGNENQIIGNTGHEVIALSRAGGEVQWRTGFEISDDEIIDSRVAIGADNAYVGLRNGEIIALSLDTGDPRTLCECEDSVVRLQMIEPGLIATTNNGALYLVDSSGKTEWPDSANIAPSIKHSQDGCLYAGDSESLLAMAEEDGTVKWQVDFPVVNDIVQVGDKLCATTRRDLIVVDAKTGERVWDYHAANEFATVSNPVVVDGVVACVTSSTFVDEEIYSFEQNILHIFDPTDGTELQSFELGVGDCYGLSAENESIVCSAGGELICIENFPTPA